MRSASLFLLLSLAACGEASDTPLEEAFCAILADSGSEAVTATSDSSGAPEVAVEDRRVEITLVDDGEGEYSGVVAYTADEAGFFAFGFDEDVPVTVVDGSGATLPWENEVRGAACSELVVRRTVQLEMTTVYLEIGSTDVPTVSLVAEESDDDL